MVVGRPGATYDGAGYWRTRIINIPAEPGNPEPPDPEPTTPYRPIRITPANPNSVTIAELNAAGLNVPTNATLKMWPHVGNPDGAYLDSVFATMGSNEILVLPEATKNGAPWPYLIDSAPGFRRAANDSRHYFSMARFTRGIVGLGPNTIINTSASSYTAPQQPGTTSSGEAGFFDPVDGTEKIGCQHKVLETSTANAYMGNLEMRGRSFGGIAYSAVAFNKGGWRAERLYFNGAHRGFRNYPNGESGGITGKSSSSDVNKSGIIENCEVECRDSTGARVGTSPFMFNSMTGATVKDFYGHHAYAGMPTFWHVNGPILCERVRSEYNGSGRGSLTGHSFNFELCTGVAELVNCTFYCNWHGNVIAGTDNAGLHIGGGSNEAKVRINVRDPILDRGPYTPVSGKNVLSIQLFGYTPQLGLDVHRYDNGVEVTSTLVRTA